MVLGPALYRVVLCLIPVYRYTGNGATTAAMSCFVCLARNDAEGGAPDAAALSAARPPPELNDGAGLLTFKPPWKRAEERARSCHAINFNMARRKGVTITLQTVKLCSRTAAVPRIVLYLCCG